MFNLDSFYDINWIYLSVTLYTFAIYYSGFEGTSFESTIYGFIYINYTLFLEYINRSEYYKNKMLGKNQSKKSIRRVSLDKIIDKPQQPNSIRNIVNAVSKGMFRNVHQIHETATRHESPVRTAGEKRRINLIKQPFDTPIQVIRQKLVKIQQHEIKTQKIIKQINVQSMNFNKKRNQQIKIPLQSYQNWKVWIGNVFIQVCDRAFQLFLNNELTYEQMKAFCSQKILLNLIQLSTNPKFMENDQFQQQIYEQLKKIIDHLCNKYPQTQKSEINKRLKEITEKNIINNSENDDYDLIDQSGIQLNYNEDGDYSKEIMKFMNYLITLTSEPTENGKNLYYNFQTFMQNVFSIVQINDKQNDMSLLVPDIINDKQKFVIKFQKQEEIEYQEKVKHYTHFAIGSKIPPNTPLYTEEEMISGQVNIQNKTIARTLDKWIQELYDKMQNSRKSIIQRTYRFKGTIPGTRLKPNPQMKQLLYNHIKKQFQNITNFKNQLCKNVFSISKEIIKQLPGLKSLSFIPEKQRSMAELACKMEQAGVQYSIQTMNMLIHCLLRGVQSFKKQWAQVCEFPLENIMNQNINVNLVTCKIGDLLRCKFSSREDEVVRIFQFLLTMSQMNYLGLFKIIRIKNRLSQGTRDILINAYFKNKVVCEIQLAVNESSHQKQSYMDKFNHFLYELKRAELGTMMELCGVWVNYDPKSKTFIKAIIQQNKIKQKNRKNICQKTFMMDENYEIIKFPFICKICRIFHTGQKTLFQNIKFETHSQPICGECISSRMKNQQRKFIIFKYNLKKNNRHKKLLDMIQEIFTLDQIDKNQIFFMIPKNATKINKYYVRKVETTSRIFFVQNSFKNGQLEIQTKFSLGRQQLKTYQKKLFQKYCIFIFNVPLLMKKIDFSKRNILQLVKKDIQHLKNPINSNISCLHLECQNRNFIFPFYKNNNCQTNYLKKAQNKKFIIKKIGESKQVLEVSKRTISIQFHELPKGILIKMNSTIKQIYLDENMIQQLDFIQHMQILQIMTARDNKLKEIPQIPPSLQNLDLTHNEISKINRLDGNLEYSLKILILCSNQISKLQNLQKFKKLTIAIFSFNIITKIQNLEQLIQLQRLILFSNPIQKIENIQNLTKLVYFVVGNSKIQKLQNLQKNQNLSFVQFNNSKLNKIQNIIQLKKLTKLNLAKNQIKQIQNFEDMSELIELNLDQNKIESMRNVECFLNIRNLNLSNNLILSIDFLDNLYQLRELYLTNNKIRKIEGLQENFMLQKIDLSGNLIEAIINISHLAFLKKLQLSRNSIKALQNIDDLSSLQHLIVSNNEINQVVGLPTFVKTIDLQNNKIESVQWLSQLLNKNNFQQVKLANNPLNESQILMIRSVFQMILPKIRLEQGQPKSLNKALLYQKLN